MACEYAPPTGKGKDALLEKQKITLTKDDGVWPDITVEKLAFPLTGSATAGNSSQNSDGTAAMLIMSRGPRPKFIRPIRCHCSCRLSF